MEISEYQRQADTTDISSKAPWVGLTQNIFGLTEKVGEIAKTSKKRLRDSGAYGEQSFREDMERYIGEALWYLSAVASHFESDLEAIAIENLKQNRERWGTHRDDQGKLRLGRYSSRYPTEERWPDRVALEFSDGMTDQSWLSMVRMTVDGEPFGDPIDDNARHDDGYRFHDVLHFAFAVHLDWSPVVRKLMKNKRKSSPQDDKYEDGARARDTEEAVSNLIHKTAARNNYFQSAERLDSQLLTNIQVLVRDLEVRDRTRFEWERCILDSYAVYRQLLENRGGFVDVDFEEATLRFRAKTP
jgi:hypothetical protein